MNRTHLERAQSATALIVDDDQDVCNLFKTELERVGFHANTAESLDDAYALLRTKPYDLILLDLMLGETNALHEMQTILKKAVTSKIWVLTAQSSIETAVEAMRAGASGFFPKTQSTQAIVNELKAAFFADRDLPGPEDEVLQGQPYGLLGDSSAMRLVRQNIWRMRDVNSTVLISGESGTGKELIARALHSVSPRKNATFAAINCGAIPETLLESELFGHRKGSFTDAKADRKGYFETCSDGTLLLDEIGEMPLALQVKLLRVLQEREVHPIGSTQAVKVDTRVIAATNKRLDDEVRAGRFREDLFYRLSVLRIESPPLRDRKEDIPVLISHFLEKYRRQFKKEIRFPSQEILARLVSYDWPGNIRELQNAIERSVVLSPDGNLHLEDIFQTSLLSYESRGPVEDESKPRSFHEAKEEFEKTYIIRLLEATHGNISEAARLSGQHRPHLYRLLGKYHIDPLTFKGQASKH